MYYTVYHSGQNCYKLLQTAFSVILPTGIPTYLGGRKEGGRARDFLLCDVGYEKCKQL